jgi:hypothetical protein
VALYIVFLFIGFYAGAVSCSTVRSFQPFIIRYQVTQQAQERAQLALAVIAGQYRV